MTATTSRLRALAALTVAGGLVLSGCASTPGTEPAGDSGSGATGAFPLTYEHMYGETVSESAPERVATWGWGATDA